jgi:transposase
MSKYSAQFKLSVVEDYLSGTGGFTSIGRRYGLDRALLRKWVAAYQIHGPASLEKKYSHYSAQFKLSALKHMREHALSYRQTAAYFDIRHVNALVNWERQYDEGGIQALFHHPRRCSKPMRESINPPPKPENAETRTREQLLEELNYLRMENAYLKKLEALIQANKRSAQSKKRK